MDQQLMDIEWGPWTTWTTPEEELASQQQAPFFDACAQPPHASFPVEATTQTPMLPSPPSPPPSPVLYQSEVAPFHQYYAHPNPNPNFTSSSAALPRQDFQPLHSSLSSCFPPPLSFPPFPFGHESPTDKRKIQRLEKKLLKMTFRACANEAALEARLRQERAADKEKEDAAAVLVDMMAETKVSSSRSSWWPWHVQTDDAM